MKVVVTGGAGCIGSPLCERLERSDHQVFARTANWFRHRVMEA